MIRTYRYRLRQPAAGSESVYEQIRLCHRYRNTLVEIERDRRARWRAILSSVGDVAALEAEAEELAATVVDKSDQDARRARRDRLREIRGQLKLVRRAAREDPHIAAAIKASDEQAYEAARAARRQPPPPTWTSAGAGRTATWTEWRA